MRTTLDREPGSEQPRGRLGRLAAVLGIMRAIDQNTEAKRALASAIAERAESERRLAETRAMLAAPADLTDLTDPANAPALESIRDYLSDLLDAVLALHKTACESLDAMQAMAERNDQ